MVVLYDLTTTLIVWSRPVGSIRYHHSNSFNGIWKSDVSRGPRSSHRLPRTYV